MRKKIYKLSRNRIILGNKRNFNYLKEIQIQSETKPYGLTVFLKVEPSAVKIEDELQVNADMTFDLIGNLETLDYKIADSKEIIASYER